MRRRTKMSMPSKYLLLVFTVFCLGMMIITFTTKSAPGPLKALAGYTIIPMQNGINMMGGWFSDKEEEFESLEAAEEENQKLKQQIDELTVENNQLRQDRFELDRLRELYDLDQKYTGYTKIAARINGKDAGNWFHSFTIDKGSNDGIAVDMNVIAGRGLVGRVVSVGPNWATVRSIIDDAHNVSAMDLATQDMCIVSGNLETMSDNLICMSQLMDTDNNVVPGDQIVTSHISDKYLQGILIGYVVEVKEDSNKLTKSGYISPAVDFEHLEEVLVITNLKE